MITNFARMLPLTPPSLPMLRRAGVFDRAFDLALEFQVLFTVELALEVQGRAEHAGGCPGARCRRGPGEPSCYREFFAHGFLRLSGSRRRWGGGSLRPSIRLHRDSAIEIRSLCDAHARRAKIAAHDRRLTDLDALLGAHVALHLAIDVDGRGVDGGDHFALLADDDALLVMDRAFDAAFDLDVFLGFQFALETQRRAKHRHAFTRVMGLLIKTLPWGCRRLTRSAA